ISCSSFSPPRVSFGRGSGRRRSGGRSRLASYSSRADSAALTRASRSRLWACWAWMAVVVTELRATRSRFAVRSGCWPDRGSTGPPVAARSWYDAGPSRSRLLRQGGTEGRMQPGPIHYATYFDRHYLTRGLALYRSLVRHSPPFVLWVLCLDDETHRTLARLRLDHVNIIRLAELEEADPALLEVKPGRRPLEYYLTCGPSFLLHLLRRQSEIDLLSYLDADLFF